LIKKKERNDQTPPCDHFVTTFEEYYVDYVDSLGGEALVERLGIFVDLIRYIVLNYVSP